MSEIPAHEILARLFSIIVSEAEASPTLAKKLITAFPETMVAKFEKPKKTLKFDASEFHAINILRTHGEGVLRGKLEDIKSTKDLRAVAKASGLVLSGAAAKAKATREDLIEGTIGAARHYVAQRKEEAA